MNLMPIEPNPKSHTTKGHTDDLVRKLVYLLDCYKEVLDLKEIKSAMRDAVDELVWGKSKK